MLKRSAKFLALAFVALFLLSGSAKSGEGWLTGDFHQHTTFTDGSYTFDYMMAKNNFYGLDWWATSEHGGGFNRNGFTSGSDLGTTKYWDEYGYTILGTVSMSGGHQNMWRWQSIRDVTMNEVKTMRNLYPTKTVVQSYEMNAPGHEHASTGIFTDQFGAKGNADALAEFEFKFDNSDGDLTGGVAQGWVKSTLSGHAKTLEAAKWMQDNFAKKSYIIPAHPERKSLWNIASYRDMNNIAPDVCFGFESMPGHQKAAERGEYKPGSNSVGGYAYGGCGIYAAKIGGLWDALLSEGRHWWLFASSDCHDIAGDFFPGEYQKTYTYVKDVDEPMSIIKGLQSGNSWVVEGDLIDNLTFKVETATMGETYNSRNTNTVYVYIKVHDPQGNNWNTYSDYKNPVLDHIDLIAGKLGNKIPSTDPNYSVDDVTATTSVIARFDAVGGVTDINSLTSKKWIDLGDGWREMSFFVTLEGPMYFRLRGTNQGLGVTNETDGAGNPLADNLMGANNAVKAFADLWFYSNPIFVDYTKKNGKRNSTNNHDCFKVYPNPTDGHINFETDESGDLRVLDQNGNEIKRFCIFKGVTRLDLSGLTAGTYYLEFNDGTGTCTELIIKQ